MRPNRQRDRPLDPNPHEAGVTAPISGVGHPRAYRSHAKHGIGEEAKSVTRQIENAHAYADRHGWTVADEHVFVDDGVSGAEFAKRPGLVRLLNALTPRPPFDVLVMSEESRLGREAIETAYMLKRIIASSVKVFFYLEDRERTLDSPTDKLMLSVTTFADEMERERARQRTADAMIRKVKAGHVTGGVVYGYDNVEVRSPEGRRLHVERHINETEAAVVRRIFELCAQGLGKRRIAHLLNEQACPAPRPRKDRPRGWCPSSVQEILYRTVPRRVDVE